MKKVFIGCAAVLLSLGLLAGCDNEEGDKVVSIKVDNAATVVVGDILELPYTVEPEKAKIEVLNDYEEYVIADAEDGVLYLEGLSEGDATITLVGTYRKYEEANVNISVSVVTKSAEVTEPEPETPTVSFSLSETSCDLTVGETIEIEYTLDPSDATVKATSGNDDYVTAEVGTDVIYLTGIGEGTTTVSVTASYEGYISATETINVSVAEGTVAVTGVTIDQGSQLTLAAGATTTLTATVTPANATNPSVEWAVTGESGVITLDTTTGDVTAGSESGSTTVTVTTVDGGYTASITITVVAEVVPEIESIAFDTTKTYSVEVGEELDVGTCVIATWKDNVTGDTPVYEFTMAENSYASLSESVITGVASTYGVNEDALPVVTASIKDNANVSSVSQAITVTEKATLTGISFTEELPESVNAGDTIELSQYISITGTGDDWDTLANAATVTYELDTTSAASITNSTVTTASNITEDTSITVTAKLDDYADATTASATISVVAPLTIMSAAFKSESYDLTIGTEKDFADEFEITYNKTGSITYEVTLSASPDENLTIEGTKVTATGNVESATLTATIKWGDSESTTCGTTISAEPEPESLTYKITIGSLGAAPEGTVLYAAGDFNGTLHDGGGYYDWGEPIELENNGDATYNLVLDFLPENSRSFEILATNPTYDNDETGSDLWDHVLGSYTITDISNESNGTTITITISTEYDSWEDGDNPVFKALGEDETIYVVFLDSTGGSGHTIVNQSNMNVGTYTVVDNKGNATFKDGANSCTPTMTTTNQSRVAFYTEEVTVPANASVEFDLYVTNNSVTYHETSPDLEVPETEEGKTNVLVLGPWFEGWLSDTPTNNEVWWTCNFDGDYANSGLGWKTMDDTAQISDFVNTISYTYPW